MKGLPRKPEELSFLTASQSWALKISCRVTLSASCLVILRQFLHSLGNSLGEHHRWSSLPPSMPSKGSLRDAGIWRFLWRYVNLNITVVCNLRLVLWHTYGITSGKRPHGTFQALESSEKNQQMPAVTHLPKESVPLFPPFSLSSLPPPPNSLAIHISLHTANDCGHTHEQTSG